MADFGTVVTVPSAGFFDDVVFHAQVYHFAFPADAFAVEDVELCLAEGRGDFVFNHFNLGFVAQNVVAFFNLAGTADIEAYGGVEFQGVAAGSGFGAAKHHADFHADLVDEYD